MHLFAATKCKMQQSTMATATAAEAEQRIVRSTITRPDGAKINYEIHGPSNGIPVLLLARGGMQSSIAKWHDPANPWNPLTRLSRYNNGQKYRLIAMDQRMSNFDQKLPDDHSVGWETFRDDQIALLDHIGITGKGECNILGSCIGPSYALQLLRDEPSRFGRAVLMQPIGVNVHTTEAVAWEGTNAGCEKEHWFGDWAGEMIRTSKASKEAIDKLHENMFGQERLDFVFTVSREDVKSKILHPMLVLCGRDIFHPAETAREIAKLAAPRATLIEEWRNMGPEKLDAAERAIDDFLSKT